MRVAVIVPCFNDGETLGQTIDSVRAQEDVELVVVDDGSDDAATLEGFARLEQEGTRVIHQANAGLSAARMAGVHATTAPYVLALDADDALEPGAASVLADALDANPGAAVAWGDVGLFGEATGKRRLAHRLDPWAITYVNELPVNALIRREALLAAGGWQLRHGYEDWDLWMGLAEQGAVGIRVPRVLSRYRVRRTRMLAAAATRHEELAAELRARHEDLYAARRRNWLRSRAPWRLKLLGPAIDELPFLPARAKFRLYHLANRPLTLLGSRVRRSLRA